MKLTTPIIILTLLSLTVKAQIGFEEHIVIDHTLSTDKPSSIFAVDIDNDGDIDILTASAGDDKIAWYENINEQDMFAKQQIITTDANNATSVFAADLDGDGYIDVLSTSKEDNKIAWYKNMDGHGNFGEQQIITTVIEQPESLFAADFDGDGDIDIAVASSTEDKIAWFENIDGQGSFGAQQIISTNADFANTVFGVDIDNDGDIDLLSSSGNDGKVAWYENTDSLGAFSSEKIISQHGAPTSVYAGDLDGDGDVDVLASSYTTNEVLWFENLNGLGTFGGRQVITSNAYGMRDVYASDLDNDGDLDVLSASESDKKIAWYENLDGQGTFGPTQIIATNKDDAMAVLTADLDNDGDLDIISTQSHIGEVYYNENLNGLGDFSESNLITTFVNSVTCILVIDLDGDGFKDLVSSSKKDDKIAWYRNLDGLGTFGVQRIISRTVDSPRSIYAADLDGDGDMDILSASYNDNTFGWYENLDGLGNFGTQNIITSEEYWPEDIFSIDIDGDGDMDVVSVSGNANWFENLDGLGNFSEKKFIEPLNANAVFAIDIDGDGDSDVLTASFDEIAWNENIDGLGVFAPKNIISDNLNNVKDIFVIDIDGDGDMDVLTATYDDDKISWYENTDGLGTFSTEKIITNTADGASGVFGIDMDNDGDIDVLSASYLDHTIAWYENLDGSGNFGVKQIISTNEINAISVSADDLDNDGDIDIFPSAHDYYTNGSSNYDKISWYENTGVLNLNNNETNNDSYNLFPVPTDNVLNIKSKSSVTKVEIYNNLGQLILEKHHSSIINTSTLGRGVYQVKVFDDKGNYVVKRILKK